MSNQRRVNADLTECAPWIYNELWSICTTSKFLQHVLSSFMQLQVSLQTGMHNCDV